MSVLKFTLPPGWNIRKPIPMRSLQQIFPNLSFLKLDFVYDTSLHALILTHLVFLLIFILFTFSLFYFKQLKRRMFFVLHNL